MPSWVVFLVGFTAGQAATLVLYYVIAFCYRRRI